MSNIDYSSFYKFLTSTGFIIIAAGVGLPLAISRNSTADSECESEICTEQIELLLLLHNSWRIASIVAILIGALMAITGMCMWWPRQKELNEKESAEAALIIRSLTVDESERKAESEIEPSTQATEALDPTSHSPKNAPNSPNLQFQTNTPAPIQKSQTRDLRTWLQVETEVLDGIENGLKGRQFLLQREVNLANKSGYNLNVDAIVIDTSSLHVRFAIEVIYAPSFAAPRIVRELRRFAPLSKYHQDLTFILIYVVDSTPKGNPWPPGFLENAKLNFDFPCAISLTDVDSIEPDLASMLDRIPEDISSPVILQ